MTAFVESQEHQTADSQGNRYSPAQPRIQEFYDKGRSQISAKIAANLMVNVLHTLELNPSVKIAFNEALCNRMAIPQPGESEENHRSAIPESVRCKLVEDAR